MDTKQNLIEYRSSMTMGKVVSIFAMLYLLLIGSVYYITFQLIKPGLTKISQERTQTTPTNPTNSQTNQFNKLTQQISGLYAQEKYTEALAKSQEVLTLAKTDEEKAIAHYWIGLNTYYGKQDYPTAERELNEAISFKSDYAAVYSTLASVNISKRDYIQAEKYAREAIKLDPNSPYAHNNLGVALLSQEKQSQAIVEFEKAVELMPESVLFQTNLKIAKENR